MPAILIPTILTTLGVAFWFRSSKRRAIYTPDFTYSGLPRDDGLVELSRAAD
jgi:cytochrome o ubiquinol oxidase subunit II